MGLMRFLLAIAVVISHSDLSSAPFALIPGYLAVEVFFSISGFYMSLILTEKYRDRTMFYVNRFLRLYPVYLVVSVATWAWFVFVWMYLGKLPANSWIDAYEHMSWWQVVLLMIGNWTMVGLDIPTLFHFKADAGFMFFHFSLPGDAPDGAKWVGEFSTIGQAWSIGVEIWFYLVAPFLIALRSRWIVLVGVASVLLKSVMIKFGLQTYFFFPAQLCFFMAGILLHRAYVTSSFGKLDRRIAYGVLTVVVILFVFFNRIPQPTANYVVYAACIPAIPVLFDLTRNNHFDMTLGNLSYPLYIVHVLIIGIAFNILHHANVKINDDLIMLAIVIVVIFVSMILYLVIEKPVDEIRQRRAGSVRQHTGRMRLESSQRVL